VRRLLARFIFDNSLLLLARTAAAVVWANVDFPAYDAVADHVFCRRAPGESPLNRVLDYIELHADTRTLMEVSA
jgi:hypothetical protein